ncbi:MAG: sigma 54-dependent Fis family transcriptional regulator [Deltaproteobacteria bacterium]|nr:sigma 54-dependent Fis family transcriptional regulator [Deltaproteobacteria bacterium]
MFGEPKSSMVSTEPFEGGIKYVDFGATPTASPLQLALFLRDGSVALPLPDGACFTLGRAAAADVVLAESSVSGIHARVSVTGQKVVVEDLGSTNGLYVDEERVARRTLRPGALLRLGCVCATLQRGGTPTLMGHADFCHRAEQELARARATRQVMTLALLRSSHASSHAGLWGASLSAQLRSFDVLGLYAEESLEVLLPALDISAAAALLQSADLPEHDLKLAAFPQDGTSVQQLLEACLHPPLRPRAAHTRTKERRTLRPSLAALQPLLERVAKAGLSVLLRGETGVGKDLVARRLHQLGPRTAKTMHVINCAAIPAGLVESTLFGHEKGAFTGAVQRQMGALEVAHGGTLFLDEVGDLPPHAQAALLRALEDGRFCRVGGQEVLQSDAQIVAATNRALEAMVERGEFRADLLFRLRGFEIVVPPLRNHPDEITDLAQAFLEGASGAKITLAAEAVHALKRHLWPGNVRELRNVIERAVALAEGDVIGLEELVGALPTRGPGLGAGSASAPFKEQVVHFEKKLILDALLACDGNQSQAARQLQLSRRTLVHKMKTFRIRKLGYGAPA